MAIVYVKHSGIELPVWRNTVDIAPSTKLCSFVKPKPKPEPIDKKIKLAVANAGGAKKPRVA